MTTRQEQQILDAHASKLRERHESGECIFHEECPLCEAGLQPQQEDVERCMQ